MSKPVKFVLKLVLIFAPLLDFSKVNQYFFGNGMFTWFLSPLNTLMDIMALPFVNKGIYQIEDLPPAYQAEIRSLIETAHRENIVAKLEERTKEQPRTMIFFKWYGANVHTFVEIPDYHRKYKYIRTIGVSVFNQRESTSRHFGLFRATLRVLYNVNDMHDKSAHIEVGKVKHYWQEEKLFIFDDTLMHQSFNESDKARYCLFVDILRPSYIPFFFDVVVTCTRYLLRGVNSVFYKNWKVIEK
ncbi:MAG: aspartyl/asparaginyl beta-hydroxylase domain-containing protein [Armatimonadaceae bacterium]